MNDMTIVEIMAGIEEMISGHYSWQAEKFEGFRDFWLDLAAQELNHASWIRELHEKSKAGIVIFNETRFNKESLREFYVKLQEMFELFRLQTQSMSDALMNSLSVESSMLEKKYFEVFDTDSPELKTILQRLRKETENHRDMIKGKLKEIE